VAEEIPTAPAPQPQSPAPAPNPYPTQPAPVVPVAETPASAPAPAPGADPAPAKEPAGEAGETLPATPSKQEVNAAMLKVRPALKKCAGGRSGFAQIELMVKPTGRVSHVLVDGTFMGKPEGSCMAREARKAKFPPFKNPIHTVRYNITF
jgi:hypothetical protein